MEKESGSKTTPRSGGAFGKRAPRHSKADPLLGGKVNCFSCGTHFNKTPPLEMMADWAFQDKLKATQEAKGNAPTNGKGKG